MDRKFIYRYVITLLMLACVFGGKAQLTLTLERTITLAADSSLDAFRYKNMYLAGYWEYLNPAKRKAMAVKNEKRFLKQKRNALKNPGYSHHPVKTQASFKRLLKAV